MSATEDRYSSDSRESYRRAYAGLDIVVVSSGFDNTEETSVSFYPDWVQLKGWGAAR